MQNFISKDPAKFLAPSEINGQTHIAMTFKFVERALHINQSSEHMLDGVVVMKVLIAMLENIGGGRIDEAVPYILRICVS